MELYENNKLFDASGVINRRNFIANILTIIIIIEVIFSTPMIFYMLTHPKILSLIVSNGTLPQNITSLLIVSGIVKSLLYIPSVTKRICDIAGKQSKAVLITSAIVILIMLSSTIFTNITPEIAYIFRWTVLFIMVFLMSAKGRITGTKTSDNLVKFNWGAFFGTWIWGLFNKSYKTLFMIPLCFTTAGFPFMLICGLKGNKWAYKNNSYDNLEQFHQKQSRQTLIWSLLTPILAFIMFVVTVFTLGIFLTNYSKTHPNYMNEIKDFVQTQQLQTAKVTFSKIELTEDEYKFYINPKKWVKTTTNHKKTILNLADIYVFSKNSDKDFVEYFGIHPEILGKTKIYSDFNNELLGEYATESKWIDYIKSKDIKYDILEAKKQILNGYRFNYHPSLP